MRRYILSGIILLFTNLTTVNAAEITACISDTSIKTNPGLVYFPVAQTKLRCDFSDEGTTLINLYEENWRLMQIVSPVLIKEKEGKPVYSPTVIYMERTVHPPTTTQKVIPAAPETNDNIDSSDDNDSTLEPAIDTNQKPGGLFNWLKGSSPTKPDNR